MSVHEVQELKEGRMKGRSAGFVKDLWRGLRDVAREHSVTLGPPTLPPGGAVTLTFRGSVELVDRWIKYVQKDFPNGVHTGKRRAVNDARCPGGFITAPPGHKLSTGSSSACHDPSVMAFS